MKSIGDEAFIDDNGQLYLMAPGVIDAFDPPGYMPPRVLKATGYTFENVPIYGWPLGVIYPNNPLQFATEATAQKLLKQISNAGSYTPLIVMEEVKVGPYTWKPIRKIFLPMPGGARDVDLNAGLLASSVARSEKTFAVQLQDEVTKVLAKRRVDD